MASYKVIDRKFLLDNLKNYNLASLYCDVQVKVIDVEETYILSDSSVTEAIEVTDDNIAEIQKFLPTITVGEYVLHIPEEFHYETEKQELYRKAQESYSKEETDELLKKIIQGDIGDLYVAKDNEDYLGLLEHERIFEEYTQTEVDDMFTETEEELDKLSNIINDDVKATNLLWSSSKTDQTISESVLKANEYAEELIKQVSTITLAYVTELPTSDISSSTIYILKASSSTAKDTLNLYYKGTWATIGEFDISMDEYYKITEVDDLLDEKANDDEVVKLENIVQDMTSVSATKILSSIGLKDELDKKLDSTTDTTNKGKYVTVDDDGKLVFGEVQQADLIKVDGVGDAPDSTSTTFTFDLSSVDNSTDGYVFKLIIKSVDYSHYLAEGYIPKQGTETKYSINSILAPIIETSYDGSTLTIKLSEGCYSAKMALMTPEEWLLG